MMMRKVMQEIRRASLDEFDRYVSEFRSMPLVDVEGVARETSTLVHYTYPNGSLNLLPTDGCAQWRAGSCAMCNYQGQYTRGQAAMHVLKEEDIGAYGKLLVEKFQDVRGESPEPNWRELVSGYDTLNDREFPQKTRAQVFGGRLFQEEPEVVSIETRAPQITRRKLEEMQKYLGSSTLNLEFGVEVGDEWIRNHWIGKGVTNNQIERAVALAHEYGMKVNPDVIIGIPGLTEEQSKQLFVDTITWLDSLGVDYITVLPVNRKKYTLQGFLHDELRNNERLEGLGLVNGEHTALPWLYTVADSILSLPNQKGLEGRLEMSQVYPGTNSIDNTVGYNADSECSCNDILRARLLPEDSGNFFNGLKPAMAEAQGDSCWKDYQELKMKQGSPKLQDTMLAVFEEVAQVIWGDESEARISQFKREVEQR
jgi:radical SAM enzyme (TIGR01210 family)